MVEKLDWGLSSDEMKERAKRGIGVPAIRGAYECILTSAIRGFSMSGAEYVDLSGEIDGFSYRFERIYLKSGDKKGNKPLRGFNTFLSLLGILGILGKGPHIKDLKARVYDSETKEFIEKLVPQFYEVLNKKIGIVVDTVPAYRTLIIDGYTKIPVEKKTEPYHIFFNDTDERVGVRYSIVLFYDIRTRMTFDEMDRKQMGENVTPEQADHAAYEIFSKKEEKELSSNEMDKIAERQLKSNLEAEGIPYDSSAFISFEKYKGKIPAEESFSCDPELDSNNEENDKPGSVPF